MTEVVHKCDYCWRERTHVDEAGGCYCRVHYEAFFVTGVRRTATEVNESMARNYVTRFGYASNPVEEHWRNPLILAESRNKEAKIAG